MDGATRALAGLLRWSMAVMPAGRREWAEAVWSEAAEVEPGWRRLAWLAGGLRLTAREAARGRRPGYPLAFAAAAAGTAWSAWSGPPGDAAIVINRVDVITMMVILAALPWIIGRACGPVSGGWPARLLRTGGYAAVIALVLVKTAVRRVADAPPNNLGGTTSAWIGEVVFLTVMASYAAVILAATARRSPAVPATVAAGTAAGAVIGVVAYTLGPLGFPLRFTGPWPARLYDAALGLGALLALCAPVAAGLAAARRDGRPPAGLPVPAGFRFRQGAMAGLCTGAAAALTVSVLSTATIALLPHDTRLRQWAAGHIGHWTPAAGHWTPIVGPGTRVGYVAGNSAFAAGYVIVLVLGPLLGCAIGAGAAGRVRLGPGRPLLAGSARPWAGGGLACCAALIAALGALFAHQAQPDRLDHAVDAPVLGWLDSHQVLAGWLAIPGTLVPAAAVSAAIAVGCLLAGRLNGVVLAAAAVPAASGLNDGLLKPLVHRTYLGILTYPSGHTAAVFALAATVAVLLLRPPQPARASKLRVLIAAAAGAGGAVVAVGVIGLRWHYFTDTVAGAAVGIGTVCVLALLLDLPAVRRLLGRASRQPSAAQPKASV